MKLPVRDYSFEKIPIPKVKMPIIRACYSELHPYSFALQLATSFKLCSRKCQGLFYSMNLILKGQKVVIFFFKPKKKKENRTTVTCYYSNSHSPIVIYSNFGYIPVLIHIPNPFHKQKATKIEKI